jgi:hypothetical protein
MKRRWLWFGMLLSSTAICWNSPAFSGDVQIVAGSQLQASTWRGDIASANFARFAYRFADLAGIYAHGRLGYATVDTRFLTQVSLGLQLWGKIAGLRPYVRLGGLHQHEETLSVIANNYLKAVFGIGDGIRHRAGGELGVGLEVPFFKRKNTTFFAGSDFSTQWFPDNLGPQWYWNVGTILGVSFH